VRSGRGLVEKCQNGLSLESGDLLDRAGKQIFERDGLIEENVDLFAIQGGDIQ
jgi:hypothetical protein